METSATIGTLAGNALYSYSAHDDGDGRLAESTVKRVSDNATLFDELLSYDPTGNVAGIATTLASGVDHQQFCYDEHNRLTWASATQGATGPCGAIIGANTVPGASYTQSFSYDTLDRLTSGPAGSYSYGDSAHLHGATTVGSGSTAYTARYDAAGDMVCRAPTGSTSCAGGTNTGQQLTWDLEGRLAAWQDAPTSPTTTASYLYDGEGQRVAQRVTASGTTTTTTYVGSLAEYTTTTGGTTSSTDYLYAAGKLVAEAVTSGTPSTTTLTYLVTNAQGTPLEALDGSGAVTASRLYTPYGASRYTSGAFPTSYGYTGQRNDATTGLDYYGARYYDPAIGQFTSADTLITGGLNRYEYVGGNPVTRIDPGGHMAEESEKGGGTAAGEGGESNENLQSSLGGGDGTDGSTSSASSGGDGGDGGDGSTTGNANSPVMAVENPDGSTTYFVPEVTEADLEADLQSVEQSQELMRDAEQQQAQQQQQQQQQQNVNTPHTPENPTTVDTPKQTLSNYRTNLKAGNDRTVAYGDATVDGVTSQSAAVSGQAPRANAVNVQESPMFRPTRTGNNSRAYDAEYKLFEHYADAYKGNPDVTGTIRIYVDRAPCASCQNVLVQFHQMFPNIDVQISFIP